MVSNSPILSATTEAVAGFSTIIAYGKNNYWFELYGKKVDVSASARIHEEYSGKWMEFYLEIMFAILITFTL